MRRLRLFLLVLAFVASATGCSGGGAEANPYRELRVSAAATLKGPFEEIATSFEEANGVRLTFNYGASGVLQKQIEGGAPVDVFASAGAAQMDALLAASLIDSASVRPFASNRLALAVPANSKLGLEGFADLTRADVRGIAAGNPKTAPHGRTAAEVLEGLGIADAVRPKIVLGENASQTFEYVSRGEVDAALIYRSEALGSDEVDIVTLADTGLHRPVVYVIGVTSSAAQTDAARAFVDFVMSEDGQAVLEKHGFALLR